MRFQRYLSRHCAQIKSLKYSRNNTLQGKRTNFYALFQLRFCTSQELQEKVVSKEIYIGMRIFLLLSMQDSTGQKTKKL